MSNLRPSSKAIDLHVALTGLPRPPCEAERSNSHLRSAILLVQRRRMRERRRKRNRISASITLSPLETEGGAEDHVKSRGELAWRGAVVAAPRVSREMPCRSQKE